jgi:hypothetical protein
MAGTYIGTTHNTPSKGHGQTIPRTRFAIPMRGHPVGAPSHGKTAPWWLKGFRSKPAKTAPPIRTTRAA